MLSFKTKREKLPTHSGSGEKSSLPSLTNASRMLFSFCRRGKQSTASNSTNWVPYLILLSGLFALSSLGTALELQTGVTSLMKSFWRTTATAICLFPFAAKSLSRQELAKLSRKEWTFYFPLCAACYAFMTVAFVTSLDMTSIVNAVILSNMTSLIIIGSKAVMGLPVVMLEASGAIIGFFGATICALSDDDAGPAVATMNETTTTITSRRLEEVIQETSQQQLDHLMTAHVDGKATTASTAHREMMGNALAFFSSFGIAAYLMIAQRLRSKLDAFVFMFLLFVAVSIYICLYIVLFSGEQWELSMHPHIGLIGWMQPTMDRLPLELYLAIICNIAGTTGYVIALKYFDPVVVSMVMLSEPAVAALQSFAAGVAPLPGLQTWIGDAVVVVGSVMVISSGVQKSDATKKDKSEDPPSKATENGSRSKSSGKNLVKRQGSTAVQRWRDNEDNDTRQGRREAAV